MKSNIQLFGFMCFSDWLFYLKNKEDIDRIVEFSPEMIGCKVFFFRIKKFL